MKGMPPYEQTELEVTIKQITVVWTNMPVLWQEANIKQNILFMQFTHVKWAITSASVAVLGIEHTNKTFLVCRTTQTKLLTGFTSSNIQPISLSRQMTYGFSAHDFHFWCVSSQKHNCQKQVENCKHCMEPQQVVSTIRKNGYKIFVDKYLVIFRLLTDNLATYHAYLW